ncbi:MAG: YggS family pyridoxal phosphate-dependent enzyme [Acholeplasmataceae bacterium]|nr:YggS family pyridoxal phosphate-dependent enzyme [Acholeplasmataceae bacterium]
MLKKNLDIVLANIDRALARRRGRLLTGDVVKLIAVTKNHPVQALEAVKALGVVDIGENRVQEARQKKEAMPEGFCWHLLGHLQTNKVKQAVSTFDIIESADSEKVLTAINNAAQQQGKIQDVLLQLNIARELQKNGFSQEAYEQLLPILKTFENIRVRGLMVIAQKCDDTEETRPVFRKGYLEFVRLREYLSSGAVDTLSMGMTHDYRVAVEEGANSVRIGTALFGERNYGKAKEE